MLYGLRHNQAMTTEPRKRFSMIREFHVADWFTLGNAVCGTGALFSNLWFGALSIAGTHTTSPGEVSWLSGCSKRNESPK